MICKSGHVTKKSVGSIKILDIESQFEIAPDQAEAFAAAIKEHGTGEKGVTIQRIDGPRGEERRPPRGRPASRTARTNWAGKAKFKPKGDGPAAAEDGAKKPFKKARWKKTRKPS